MPKGEKILSPKQKDRTTTNFKIFKIFKIKFSIGIFQISMPLEIISQLVSIFQIDIYLKTLLKAKRRISFRGVLL
jgi:NADH:ubiquinone oxidoreductase subunit 4 (subunit M)